MHRYACRTLNDLGDKCKLHSGYNPLDYPFNPLPTNKLIQASVAGHMSLTVVTVSLFQQTWHASPHDLMKFNL